MGVALGLRLVSKMELLAHTVNIGAPRVRFQPDATGRRPAGLERIKPR